MKFLMVCLGNICRSPLAEGILEDLIEKNNLPWTVDSAGTNAYHNGEAPHRLSQKVALQHHIDISQQRSRKITTNDLHEYDIIYAMATDVLHDITRMACKNVDTGKVQLFLSDGADVPDPWYGAEDGYHVVYDIIEKRCKTIIEQYNK